MIGQNPHFQLTTMLTRLQTYGRERRRRTLLTLNRPGFLESSTARGGGFRPPV